MKRILLLIVASVFILVSCNKDGANKEPQKEEIKTVTLEALNRGDYEYKSGDVSVEGLCVHVCSHSGKKMFLSGSNPDDKLQIFTGETMSVFPKDLEGSKVKAIGVLEEERLDMNYVKEWEAEIAAEEKDHEGHSCTFEDNMKKVNNLRELVEKSPKGYISKYTMICKEFKKI